MKNSHPVFIHSLFRTSSTYIWNKFRRNPKNLCYYEPFHHVLATLTTSNVKFALTSNFIAAGHPPLKKHYLFEYESLLRKDREGIPYFKKEFSYDHFCQFGEDEYPEQKQYLDFLIQQAGDRVPVLQFNRTALRSAWFKAHYPQSLNIYLCRNPRDQWQSYFAIQERLGFDAFFIMDLMALSKSRENPIIRPLTFVIPLLRHQAAEYKEEEAVYRLLLSCYDDHEKYFLFYYLWLASLLVNIRQTDLLLDINALSDGGPYRDQIESAILQASGESLDFSDCRVSDYAQHRLPPQRMAKIEGHVQALMAATFPGGCPRELPDILSPRLKDLLTAQWKKGFEKTDATLSNIPLRFLILKSQELENLRRELQSKDEQIARYQNVFQRERDLREENDVQLMKLKATVGRLRNELNRLRHSYAFRIGRTLLFPWRTAKYLSRRPKRIRFGNVDGRSEKERIDFIAAAERKISVADQIRLNFGRHRSGLKYGLQHLRGLHHPKGVLLDAFIERTFSWTPERCISYSKSWIGFIHVPPHIPPWFHAEQSNLEIFESDPWKQSLPFCRGLFAFSKYHQRHLERVLPVSVETLLLPSEVPSLTWTWEAFESNPDKKVIQVGWWLRKLHAIYQLPPTPFQKVLLHVGHRDMSWLMEMERQILAAEGAFRPDMYDSVRTIPFLSNTEYDSLLSRNIVFMFLYDVSASNAIVECIIRHTPLLINPLEAVLEYLGQDYPFYYRSLEEAAAKLMDRDLIAQTHQYLRDLPIREKLSGVYFSRAVLDSKIYRSLPPPPRN
jgi:hypothetical protein